MEMLSAGPWPLGAPATGRKSGRMVMSGLREVTSCAAAVISPLMMWICDRVSGFWAQPARKKRIVTASAAQILQKRAGPGNEATRTKLNFEKEISRMNVSRGAARPREFFTTVYAALRVAA